MDRTKLAAKIAAELRELANIVEQAGNNDPRAMTLLGSYIDGYHHGIVVGSNEVQRLTELDEVE